ncbi:MAG TPA: NUDIX hydrolase [Magnetospirillaceae bacterium]|nr:NUDIX hydrolase [Magnetospirillaceae bacterium]
MPKPHIWNELASGKVADCRIFDVSSSDRACPDGRRGTFFLINAPDWAGVIPVVDTPEGRAFVMIRQFRHGTGRRSFEFPGGIVDPGEGPAQSVARELLEETGYRAEIVVPLGLLSPNPAFMTNIFHAFIAEGCVLDRPPTPGVNEDIEVFLVPERDAIDLVGAENYGHALMTATLFLYMRYRGFCT